MLSCVMIAGVLMLTSGNGHFYSVYSFSGFYVKPSYASLVGTTPGETDTHFELPESALDWTADEILNSCAADAEARAAKTNPRPWGVIPLN